MERIQSEQQYLDTINSDGFTVIKFDTTWCPDCKNLDRFIGDVIDQHTDKTFYALDAEKFQPLPKRMVYAGFQACSSSRTARKSHICIANGLKHLLKSPSIWRRLNPKFKRTKAQQFV